MEESDTSEASGSKKNLLTKAKGKKGEDDEKGGIKEKEIEINLKEE